MTIKQTLINMLIERGMFLSQANEVMELAVPQLNDLVEGYSISLDSRSDDYPKEIYKVLFGCIRPIALKWIDDNKPQAWYRDVFVD
jgi:hypothetical protein